MMNNQQLKQYCEAIIAQHEAYAIPVEQMPADNQALVLMAKTTLAALTTPPAPKANPCLKAMMQALDAFYAEEVPERGMLLAFRILLDDYQARTQQEARND